MGSTLTGESVVILMDSSLTGESVVVLTDSTLTGDSVFGLALNSSFLQLAKSLSVWSSVKLY